MGISILHVARQKIRQAPFDAQFLAPIWRSVDTLCKYRKMSQHLDHVLREIAIVKKVVAHGNRFFQTPDVVLPVRRYQQRIAWFDGAFVGRRGIEEGKSLEIRLFWI